MPYPTPNTPPPPPAPGPPPPKPRRYRLRFRWQLVWIVASILLAAVVIHQAEPAFTWDDVMDALRVHDRARYTRLGVLGLTLICITTVFRLLSGRRDDP